MGEGWEPEEDINGEWVKWEDVKHLVQDPETIEFPKLDIYTIESELAMLRECLKDLGNAGMSARVDRIVQILGCEGICKHEKET